MIGRRQFITLLGGAASWPLAARAQQPRTRVIGFLYSGSHVAGAAGAAAFRRGLSEAGFMEGRDLAIEYRYGENQADRLRELATDLVRRRVTVIAAVGGVAAALAAKAATNTIPIVFGSGGDPVQTGLVASLNRPGGNLTGVSYMISELAPKRLGLLHELLPQATRFAVLFNPSGGAETEPLKALEAAASATGSQLEIVNATTNGEIDGAIADLAQKRADGVLVYNSPVFNNRRVQLATLAVRYAMPTVYYDRVFTEAGGLMSYGSDILDQYRQVGSYAARILKGEKLADLPVVQPTKFEFIVNLHTAKLIGLTIPPTLLAIADEVIE
jgi:putative tryptophan/tyrosine transport system substrate-binding protein